MNVNNTVFVKITDSGVDELRRQHEELSGDFPKLGPFEAPKVDADGYTAMQLHVVMNTFGHLMHVGNANPPIETEIKTEG